jgi:hypothetical protein
METVASREFILMKASDPLGSTKSEARRGNETALAGRMDLGSKEAIARRAAMTRSGRALIADEADPQ